MVVAGTESEDSEFGRPTVERSRSTAALLSRATFVGGMTLTVALFAVGAWNRRWIADDGLIVLRTVRNLLAGNGPVFNEGERVETNTSAAWTYVVWFFSWVTHLRLEYVVLGVTLALSMAAIVFAMIGTARLWGGAAASLLLPAGALVYIALPPARDYASSGLESGLVIFWVAVLWWLLVRWARAEQVRLAGLLVLAFWAGLAPVVRPEMTMFAAPALLMVFCAPVTVARWRPIVVRALMIAAAGLIPVGYQIWRMGYYGLPYPNTAVAKDAGGAKWKQGFTYLWDLVGPYYLWVPLLVLLVVGVLAVRPRLAGRKAEAPEERRLTVRGVRIWLRSPSAVVTLVLGSALILTVYALRVGGDFMHGRVLLTQLFMFLLPVAVVPVRLPVFGQGTTRDWSFAVIGIALLGTAGWALFAANTTAIKAGTKLTSTGIVDERIYYVLNSGHDHPILAEDYLDYPRMRAMVNDIANTPNGALLLSSPSYMSWFTAPPPLPIPEGGAGHTVYFLNLGMTSMNVPLNVRVIDQMGLAYPLAAHTDRLTDGRIGHDKNLYPDWVIVDTGMVDQHPWMPFYLDERWVSQARVAMSCPDTRALLISSRDPLTFSRFRHNFKNAMRFAKYRIDRVPKYELQRCGLPDPFPTPQR
ncbi:flagellar motor control protein ZomB [Nocardia panacis]|nr:flagellar motor control protein ZomB [Nocardia panacis]